MTDYMDKLKNCEEFFWVNPGFVPPTGDAGTESAEPAGAAERVL